MTLTMDGEPSVREALKTTEVFSEASSLKLNQHKTNGLIITPSKTKDILTPIDWTTTHINLLGTTIGHSNPDINWTSLMTKLKDITKTLNDHDLTLDAKSVLSKTKLLPLIQYTATTNPLSEEQSNKLSEIMEDFIAGKRKLKLPMETLHKDRMDGGYNIANLTIYAHLHYLKNITRYCRHRAYNTPLTPATKIIEYNIGHQISKLYNFAQLNHVPHAATPSPFYAHSLDLIRKYQITDKELCSGKIKAIYKQYISSLHSYI